LKDSYNDSDEIVSTNLIPVIQKSMHDRDAKLKLSWEIITKYRINIISGNKL
jgi:hypothetical protein